MDRVTFLPAGSRSALSAMLMAGLFALVSVLALATLRSVPAIAPGSGAIAGAPLAPLSPPARAGALTARGAPALRATALASLSQSLAARNPAYRASQRGAVVSVANPAQHLDARFGRAGVQLSAGALRVGLRLRALIDGEAVRPLAAVTPVARGATVSFAHAGVNEWYVNGPLGLEQGFSLARALGAAHASGSLTLALALAGNGTPTLEEGGQRVTFAGREGRLLRYGALHAADANGRTLPSWLSLAGGELRLHVDARGARYPLTIDPLVQQQKILGHAGARTRFGFGVAVSADGNTAAVSARKISGAGEGVWVFARSGSTWSQQGALDVGAEGDGEGCPGEGECEFSGSVALSGDGNTAIVGNPLAEERGGAAFVFVRSGTSWSAQATLTVVGANAHTLFGRSVALSGDGSTAVVGGPAEAHGGAAWIFTRSGSSWTEAAKLSDPARHSTDRFGRSVAISQDAATVLAGAPGTEHGAGAAWAFSLASSVSEPPVRLSGTGESGTGLFGLGVALSSDGTTALVAARSDEAGNGAAWVFGLGSGGWTQLGPKLGVGSADAASKVAYGAALSADGSTVVLGAPRDGRNHGHAWVFRRSASTWTLGEQLAAGEERGAAWFGASAALSQDGRTALIGGMRDNARTGAAWVFHDNSVAPSEPEPPQKPPANRTDGKTPPPVVPGGTQIAGSGGVLGSTSVSLPAPKLGVSGNLMPVSGTVRVKLPGSKHWVTITGALQVPFGTIIDARNGKVTLTTAGPNGSTQTATFYAGVFRIAQSRSGSVTATLYGGNFSVCPTAAERHHLAHASATQRSRRHSVRRLWAEGHGSYTTKGNYATGAVLGTRWLTEDRCGGTLIRVLTDKVAVVNLVNHRHRTVHAGHSYFAKAPG